jgi:hypothetical protein
MMNLSKITLSVTFLSFVKSQIRVLIAKIGEGWKSSTDHHLLSANSITKLAYSHENQMWLKPLLPLYSTKGCYPFVTLDHFLNFKAQNLSNVESPKRTERTCSIFRKEEHCEQQAIH